ncbi:MAG: MFS transporter [Rubrivivax sp.]
MPQQLRLASVAAFASIASMRACDPMLLTLASEFGRGLGECSRVVSMFAVAYGVMQLLYGPLGDRIGKLAVVAGAATVCALFATAAAFATSLEALVAVRTLMGAAAAGIVPMTIAWIGDNVPYAQRQETLARLLGATVGGMIAGLWLGAWITELVGWRMVFAALAVTFIAAALPLWRELRRARAAAAAAATAPAPWGHSLVELAQLPRLPEVRFLLAIVAVEGALMFSVLAFVPAYLAQRHGLGTAAAGSVLALYGVGGIVYSRLARRLLHALGERGLAIWGGAIVALAVLGIAWAPHWLAAAPACLVAGAAFYMLHTTLQARSTQMAPAAQRGSGVALFASCLFFGQSVGVAAVSAAVERGAAQWAFSASALGLAVVGAVVGRRSGRGASAA